MSSFRTPRSGDPEPSAFFENCAKALGWLAPSLALAFGVRVGRPVNAVGFGPRWSRRPPRNDEGGGCWKHWSSHAL